MLSAAMRSLLRKAGAWERPYTSVQWAWVRALGLEPSGAWRERGRVLPRHDRMRDAGLQEAMRQRHGVRGL